MSSVNSLIQSFSRNHGHNCGSTLGLRHSILLAFHEFWCTLNYTDFQLCRNPNLNQGMRYRFAKALQLRTFSEMNWWLIGICRDTTVVHSWWTTAIHKNTSPLSPIWNDARTVWCPLGSIELKTRNVLFRLCFPCHSQPILFCDAEETTALRKVRMSLLSLCCS